jgi:adhesin transport system outer membrane protein
MRNSQFAVSFTRRPKKLALIILLAMSGHSAPLYASDEELYLFSKMASENARPTLASPAPRAVPRARAVANPAVAPVRTQPARQPATSFARVPQNVL